MCAVSHCCSLLPMTGNLLIALLQWEAKSGPAALSAVSLLTLTGKTLREYSQRNKRNIKKPSALSDCFNYFCVINSADVGSSKEVLISTSKCVCVYSKIIHEAIT